MDWQKEVYSTNVLMVGYDSERKEMVVTWQKGKRSIYSDVPEDVALDTANAPSVGSFLNSNIKGKYQHRYG